MEPQQLSQIYKILNRPFAGQDLKVGHISTDSRTVEKDDVFIAVKGERFDGHDFALAALEAGAACVLSEKEISADPRVVVVENTLSAYHRIAAWYRNLFPIPVIAVTGSNGKTTTKDIVYEILSSKYQTRKTPANHNNEIGVPQTVFQLSSGDEALVVEFGMRGPGQIKQLRDVVSPSIAIITMIGEAHFELLGSYEAIARAKAELVEGHMERVILNADDRWTPLIVSMTRGEVFTFGSAETATLRLCSVEENAGGYKIGVCYAKENYLFDVPFIGMHNVYNTLAALLAGFLCGVDARQMNEALKRVLITGKRMEKTVCKDGLTVVNDSYNASPSSMRWAIKTLTGMSGVSKRVAVLGDMRELGDISQAAHREIGCLAAGEEIDYLITIGESAHLICEGALQQGMPAAHCRHFTKKEDSLPFLNDVLDGQSVVLVKASRLLELESIAEYLINFHGGCLKS